MAEALPDGYTAPVCQAITTPMLLCGVPRSFFILNMGTSLGATFGLKWWWYAAVGFGLYWVVKLITKYDPDWLTVLCRSLRYTGYYEA